jgi:hypothetical protein
MVPGEYIGDMMQLVLEKRGEVTNTETIDDTRVMLSCVLPLSEILVDFNDKLKSMTRGYGSMDYEHSGYRAAKMVKMDMLIAGDPVEAFSTIVHRDKAESYGRVLAGKLKEVIPNAPLRRRHPGRRRRQDRRPRIHLRHAQERHRQVLRRRHHPQTQAAGEAEGREKEDEDVRQGQHPQDAFIKVLNRSFTQAKLAKLIEAIDQAATRYLDELQQVDQNENPASSGEPSSQSATAELQRKLAKIKQRKALLSDYQTRCQDSPTGQVNLTDPDARQLRKRGKSTVGYNVQAAVDAKHHLIATVEVTQEPTDHHLLDPIAQQTKQALHLPAGAPLKVLADTGYGTGPQHHACEAHGTIALAPVQANNSQTNGLYNNDRFTHDPVTDSYTCPQGHTLTRKADTKSADPGGGFHTYQCAAACHGCPVRARCTKSPFRKLLISVHHAVIVRSRQRLAADPTAMRRRASLVEHPFSTIKDRHGYTGLLCKGIQQASAEMNLSAWAYNFTRVVNLVGLDVLLQTIRLRNAPPLA